MSGTERALDDGAGVPHLQTAAGATRRQGYQARVRCPYCNFCCRGTDGYHARVVTCAKIQTPDGERNAHLGAVAESNLRDDGRVEAEAV